MVKINMMCGKRDFGSDWVHVDSQNLPHILNKDILLRDIPDGTVDLIYCSHGIAYFDRDEIIPILQAWKSKLKTGGILRLATPDWRVLRCMDNPLLGPLYGKMNEPAIYHKTVYNYCSLKKLLEDIGFTKIRHYNHKKTDHAQFDDHSAAYYQGILISLNVQCNA